MKQIRNSVFETNSSSMHSLVIRNDNTYEENESRYYTKEEIKDNVWWWIRKDSTVCDLSHDDLYFGRAPFMILDSFMAKFKYALANGYSEKELLQVLSGRSS